ncbi:uncharacterized protein LOC131015784 [Salvia miltiorrhiza]|uniref:uncharacterized protein LOC131015784 n=1 Tax=Salvia miltiorrhiza TaxID=226208 RepID=UPI0025AB9D0E|nr:uncharacterized protein LOC131015784 [Salvia miltiorrhiza]
MASEAIDSLLQTLRQILKRDDVLTTLRVKQRIISIHDKAVFLLLNLKHFPKQETIREVVNTTQEIIEYIFSPENVSDCGSTEASVRLSIQLGELAGELPSTAADVVDYCNSHDDLVRNLRRRSDSSSRSAIVLIVSLLCLLLKVERIIWTARSLSIYYRFSDYFRFCNRSLKNHDRFFRFFIRLSDFDEDLRVATELIVSISIRLLGLAERIMSTTGDSVDNVGRQSDSPAVRSSSRSALNSEDFDDLHGDPTLATKLFVSSNRLARLADRIQWTARDLIDNSTADGSSPTSALKSADFDGFDEDLGFVRMQILHFSGVLGRLAEEIMSAEDYATVGSSSTSALESVMASEQFLQISDELERLADEIMSTAKGSVDNVGRLNDSPAVATELTDSLGRLVERIKSTAEDSVKNIGRLSDSPAVGSSSRSALKSEDFDGFDQAVATELTLSISNRLGRLAERIKSTAEDSVKNIGRLSDSPAVGSSSRSALKSEDFDGFDQAVATELTLSISNRLGRLAERIKWTAVGSSSRSSPTRKDVVVGFDEDRLQIMSWLTSYSSELQVLPIVGMGGIGKSTLAKIVYDDTFITYHFDFHAWVTISKDYNVEIILSNLLASMKGKGIQAESDLQCKVKESEIYKYLKGRRYLIVVDDIWSMEAWDHIQRLLPDDNNGSRIILTTRLKNVATYASSMSPIHTMHFLDDQQSWRLFQKKVFGDQDCPVELQDIGEKYVKRCEGLPLSIVTVAGLLSKIDRTPKLWKRIGANDGQLETILLSLSYKHLPRHLRECFLYMAGFPEDYEIRVSELIKLWVAEGFLDGRYESKMLEEVAEDVLEVLVEQSLVLVTSKKSDGKIKRCKLHSVVRDFCSRQAGEEKLLLPIMDYFPNPIVRRHFLPQVLENHQRLSVNWCDLDLKDSMHSSCTHSIICCWEISSPSKLGTWKRQDESQRLILIFNFRSNTLQFRDNAIENTQVLKLKNHACYGEHWKTIEGGFVDLRLLHIDESNLQNWTTECSHFPRLQRLMLHRCLYLSKIPVDIGKIPTLELIEIDDHNRSLLCRVSLELASLSDIRLMKEAETQEAWDDVRNILPDDGNGRRVILMTRETDVDDVVGFVLSCFALNFNLIKLWVAEGFLRRLNRSKTLEEEAEVFLEDLVKRNLVLVTKRKCDCRIKSCSLHDLMRDLCIRKAHEEKFLVNFSSGLSVKGRKNQRRVSVTRSGLPYFQKIYGLTIHTILCFHGISVANKLEGFRLLRVLDAGDVYVRSLPDQLFDLFYLAYLGICYLERIPAAISKLHNLETLSLRAKNDWMNFITLNSFCLPLEIWRMPRLRHLVFYGRLPNPEGIASSSLENLQTLSIASHAMCSERILRMIPNLKKLEIDCSDGEIFLNNLVHLRQLEDLKLRSSFRIVLYHKHDFTFPKSLRKLTLSRVTLPWEEMTIVGSLPNLRLLKLTHWACKGSTWETSDGEFPKLEILVIEKSLLEDWITESSHFPMLKSLVLDECLKLAEIPEDIGEIPTLELIEVKGEARTSLVESAQRILQKQQEWGNDALQVRCMAHR